LKQNCLPNWGDFLFTKVPLLLIGSISPKSVSSWTDSTNDEELESESFSTIDSSSLLSSSLDAYTSSYTHLYFCVLFSTNNDSYGIFFYKIPCRGLNDSMNELLENPRVFNLS
jgi:hypothetical protein